MTSLPLELNEGHLFAEIDGRPWLIDTGSPASFGSPGGLDLAGQHFDVPERALGLDPRSLSQHVGVPCVGLLGADVLGGFDHVLDEPGGRWTVSADEPPLSGAGVVAQLDEFMGIPIVSAQADGTDLRAFFDTGAQVSYLPAELLAAHPPAGRVTDFYPGFGRFETETHHVPVAVGGVTFTLRCGALPPLLAASLLMAGTTGIVGVELLVGREVGYFPRRGLLVV